MRAFLILCGILRLGIGCAIAQEPPAQPPANAAAPANADAAAGPISADSSIDQVLDALDAVGRNLKDFTADVRLTETDLVALSPSIRDGKAIYQKKPDGQDRMRVTFDTLQKGKNTVQQKLDYLLDNGWLIDRNYAKSIQVSRQMLQPGQKLNLLKLGEGPFPLPIGQSKEEVHRLFDVKKIAPAKDDPAGTVHLQLIPKPKTQFDRKFSSIDVWVDIKSHMPRRIATIDQNQTTERTTDLDKIQLNQGAKDADFVLPPIDKSKWELHDESFNG